MKHITIPYHLTSGDQILNKIILSFKIDFSLSLVHVGLKHFPHLLLAMT